MRPLMVQLASWDRDWIAGAVTCFIDTGRINFSGGRG